MTNKLYLICGVPGAGKTWVCNQLKYKYTYLPHDDYKKTFVQAVINAACTSARPLISECPFGETEVTEQLGFKGITVYPYFIVESPHIVSNRYFKREGKPLYKGAITRATTIKDRAIEWDCPFGTAQEILELLK